MHQGFTIVELLVVIIVIAIVASVTAVAYSGMADRAVDSSRSAVAGKLQRALENFFTLNDRYPTHTEIGSASIASTLGLIDADLQPYGHTGLIDVGFGASSSNTGIVYLATTGANFSGSGCGNLPSICHYYQFSYWSKSKQQQVVFSNSR